MEMNYSKIDLGRVFPLSDVVDNAIISKKGDITFGWAITLPSAYTFDESDYDALISRLSSAARNLPPWSILHKQDIFTHDSYEMGETRGFLGSEYEKHFDGRKYLRHECRLFLTFSGKSAMWHSMGSCSVFGIKDLGKSEQNIRVCTSKAKEFIAFLEQCEGIKIRQITGDEFLGDSQHPGMIQSYMMMDEREMDLSHIMMGPDFVKAFDRKMVCFSVSKSDDMPSEVSSVKEISQLSTDNSSILLSSGALIGISLDCDHIVNQYVAIVPQQGILKDVETKRRRMKSSGSNVENRANAAEMEEVQADANGGSLFFVKSHINVMVWDSEDKLDETSGVVKSAMSTMGINAVFDSFDAPVLFFAGLPGAESELHKDNYMTLEIDSALCPWIYETFDTPIDGGGFKVCDRLRNVPITLDTGKAAERAELIDNYNAFILGPSGTGKSFVTNFYLRQCYDSGAHIFIVDIGDSYEGLCKVINEESGGRNGIYNQYNKEHPLSLNPFVGYEEESDGKSASLMYLEGLMKTIWTPKEGWTDHNSPILTECIRLFMSTCKEKGVAIPTISMFNNFVGNVLSDMIDKKEFYCGNALVEREDFNCEKFCHALSPFTESGTYPHLLNNRNPEDMSGNRFVVFELSSIKEDEQMLSIVTSTIMHEFERVMAKVKEFKYLVIDEAWKSITNKAMEPKIMELWRTARKHSASAVVVTQNVEDIISSPIIKNVIINNSSTKILLDQSNNKNNFAPIAGLFGLSQKETALVLSTRKGQNPTYSYREVFIQIGRKSGVYGIEASKAEQIAYQSNKEKKQPFLDLAERLGSAIGAIKKIME